MDPAPTWSAGRAVLSCSRQTRICSGAHPALVWRQSRRVGPAADGNAQMNRHSAFADAVAALDEGDFELLRRAVDERCCREKHGFGTLAEAADPYRTDPACPSCRAASPFRDGRTAGGVQRWRCRACGARFTSLTGTVLEGSKSDMATWCRFIGLMRFNVPLDAMAEELGITHQTAWEWRHRVMAAVDGYQDRIVLRDLVWIDETYVNDADLHLGYGVARKRGPSRQKVCIAVAIDVHKNPVAVVCGRGKPSSARVLGALGGHIAEGSLVVHDRERAHGALIRESGCAEEAHRADVNDPVYLERMAMVNNLCSWLKRYLWRFTGMSMSNLQSYLNWFVYLFRVKQDSERWPETARVVRHLLLTEARFRSST